MKYPILAIIVAGAVKISKFLWDLYVLGLGLGLRVLLELGFIYKHLLNRALHSSMI